MPLSQRLPEDFYAVVRSNVATQLASRGLDAVVTDSPEDIAYLTGFFHHPCERPVIAWVTSSGHTLLLLPELEYEHAQDQKAYADLVSYPEFPGRHAPLSYLAEHVDAGGRIFFNPGMSVRRLDEFRHVLPRVDFHRSELIGELRAIKSSAEVAMHQEAARITDTMLTAGRELVQHALTTGAELPSEAELAAHVSSCGLSTMYAEHDAVVVVSPLAGGLVYTASNSSRPHGLPSARRLSSGDTFMLSLGCAVGGRFVEGERTFILGEPSKDQRRYYDAVWQAQHVGEGSLRPGVRCREANLVCLDVLREAGMSVYIRHRQGHGIGLGMHEPPWLEEGDETELEAGMIVSNEPGVYVPGHAGYRISDSVLITHDGPRALTSFPKTLDEVVIPL